MIETLKKEWQAKFAVGLLLLLTLWYFISPSLNSSRYFGDFPSIYGVMALWGGFWGISISRQWGFTKSIMGKAILFFTLGLFAQEFGQIVYAYYSFFQHVEIPYPSLGDIGYFGSIPLYIYAVFLLAQASGVKIGLQSVKNKILLVLIPVFMLGVGYFLFLQDYALDWSDPVRVFLDFGYPLGQAIYIAMAVLTYSLTRGVLGGIMKPKILFFLFALVVQFLADYVFLIQAYYGSWGAGGFNDYMYLLSYFFMTLAILQLKTVRDKLQHIS